MWTRITSSEQLKKLGVGTMLIKYPQPGDDVRPPDFDDKERLSVRYIIRNIPTFEEFDISLIPYQIEHSIYLLCGLSNLSFAAMHKKYHDVIAEGSYWFYRT